MAAVSCANCNWSDTGNFKLVELYGKKEYRSSLKGQRETNKCTKDFQVCKQDMVSSRHVNRATEKKLRQEYKKSRTITTSLAGGEGDENFMIKSMKFLINSSKLFVHLVFLDILSNKSRTPAELVNCNTSDIVDHVAKPDDMSAEVAASHPSSPRLSVKSLDMTEVIRLDFCKVISHNMVV